MKTKTYIVTAPVTEKKEAASRLLAMTLSGQSATEAKADACNRIWTFSSKAKATKFMRGLPGAVLSAKGDSE